MRAGIYARISKDVEETGLGVDRQREDCERKARSLGWEVARVFIENGVSAFDRRKVRPQYRVMMAAIESGEIDAVVVWDIDRLYRQPIELEQLVTLAESGRVKLATCSGDIDLGTDNGIFMARTLVNVANKSSKDASRRIKREQKQRAERGLIHGMRPYGYKNADGRVVIDPGEAAHVRFAVDALKRGVSLRKVCRDTNAAGALTQKGNQFKPADLIRTLLNPALYGARTRHGQVAKRNAWEPIITEDEHNELRTLRHVAGSRPGQPATHLLSGILRCGKCGGPLFAVGRTRYACSDKEKGGCNGTSISATDAEREVVEYVHDWIGSRRSNVGTTPVVPVDVAQQERVRLTELGDA